MIRDEVMSAEFSETALFMSSSGTISTTNERRAGLSKATVKPPTREMAKIAAERRVAHEGQGGERERLQHGDGPAR